jgi:S-DNA-T family DNA segregation ATPase FtsK/SpoIIIE
MSQPVPSREGERILSRQTRLWPEAIPQEPIEVPLPPTGKDELQKQSVAQFLLPAVGAIGFTVFFLLDPTPLYIAIGIVFLISMVGTSVGMGISRNRNEKKALLRDQRRYLMKIQQLKEYYRLVAERQLAAGAFTNPSPAALAEVIRSGRRLWERRPNHSDFLAVRLGRGEVRPAVPVKIPKDTGDRPVVDPVCQYSFLQLSRIVPTIKDAVVSLFMTRVRRVLFTGDDEVCAAALRAVLLQAFVWHGPDDVRLIVGATPERAERWEWVKWLPHVRWCELDVAGGSAVFCDPARFSATVSRQIELRVASRKAESALRMGEESSLTRYPHLIVVVDGMVLDEEGGPAPQLHSVADLGVTMLELGSADRVPPTVDSHIEIGSDGVVKSEPVVPGGAPTRVDQVSVHQAEVIARLLAPWRVAGGSLSDSVRSRDMAEALGLGSIEQLDVDEIWQPRSPADFLTIPLGTTSMGQPLVLDLKEAALGGMGPHGLMVGATGSGKSELLRTLVIGLCLRHPPEDVACILVDFKGGATFAGLSDLPHVAGIITNLEDDLTMVDRMRDAITGELQRRQEMLAQAGNLASAWDYRRLRSTSRPDLEPMPNLVVIVDEFAELVTARPDFVDVFVTISRIGRSLGIHLLLASQRLEDGKLRGLDSNVSYRIALRTFSAGDSIAVIGVRDAYYLPTSPGSAILKVGNDIFQKFRATHVSGPYVPESEAKAGLQIVKPFEATAVAGESSTSALELRRLNGALETAVGQRTVVEEIVGRLRRDDRRAHQVWLPPLEAKLPLGEIVGPLLVDPDRGLMAASWPGLGRLKVPIGICDRPQEMCQEVEVLDFDGKETNIAIVGSPRSGKSTAVATLVMATALTHCPTETQFYIVDLGGGRLADVAGLPHVGTVVFRGQSEQVTRAFVEIMDLIASREQLFRSEGIAGVEHFRRLRREGRLPNQPLGDVFFVVDNLSALRRDHESLEPLLLEMATRGPGVGVHLVVTANRWSDVRSNLRDNISGMLELKLNDPFDSAMGKRLAADVPVGVGGRGLDAAGLQVQIGAPVLELADGDDDEAIQKGIQALCEASSRAWKGPSAPRVRVLPTRIELDALLPKEPIGRPAIALGLDEQSLAPVFYEPRQGQAHLLVLGDAECGKSNFLRCVIRSLVATAGADKVAIHLADPRFGLVDLSESPGVVGYATSPVSLGSMIESLVGVLNERIPPSDTRSEQLQRRAWWSGPEIFVILDDYDLIAAGSSFESPLAPLTPFLAQGYELGFHVVVARRVAGAMRGLNDPLLSRLREYGNPGLIMAGDPLEGTLIGGFKAERMVVGRGRYVSRQDGVRIVQTAIAESAKVLEEA